MRVVTLPKGTIAIRFWPSPSTLILPRRSIHILIAYVLADLLTWQGCVLLSPCL